MPPSRNALLWPALVLAALVAPSSRAANPVKAVAKKLEPHHFSAAGHALKTHPIHAKPGTAHGKFVLKKAIKHVPFPEEHFHKLADQAGNVKLPNGQSIKVGDFHAAVHHVEQALNGIGHSMRHDPGKRTRLGHHDDGHAQLASHHAAITAQHKKVPHTKATQKDAENHHAAILALRQSNASSTTTAKNRAGGTTTVVAASTRGAGNSASDELAKAASMAEGVAVKAETAKTFNLAAGDPKHFSAYLRGKAALQGDATFTGLHAEVNAGGSLMGHSQDILQITADFTGKKTGELEARVDASILKKSIYSLAKRATKSWSKTERIQKTVDVSATVPIFSLGAISVVAKIGVSGSAGIDYGMALGPGIVGGHITPFIDTQVYVQAKVQITIPIAEAGAEGKLTLLKDELELTASASLVPAEVKGKGVQWGIYNKLALHNSMTMLSGDVSAFLKLHYPCLKGIIPHICNKEFDYHLFGWAGLKSEGELFSASKFVSLGIPATKMSM